MQKTTVILGLGSNLGDRRAYLRAAHDELSRLIAPVRCSRVYESRALLPDGAPAGWGGAFLNMAIGGECTYAPEELLAEIKDIERKLGRQNRGHWAPREIDIDILAMGERVVVSQALHVPHRELASRDFALLPLAEIAPDWLHPALGLTARALVQSKGYKPHDGLKVAYDTL